jgi:antagonist of KipI
MAVKIIKSGVLETIQDMGRFGGADWGINPGGAMDSYAMRVANFLTGNSKKEAVIEFHFPAMTVRFEKDCMIALTGADFSPNLNDQPAEMWKPLLIKAGTVLSFSKKTWGERCYLAISDGFQVENWLGSCSTNQKIKAGGFQGRKLITGDKIDYQNTEKVYSGFQNTALPWKVNTARVYENQAEIHFIEGTEFKWLTSEQQKMLFNSGFTIDPASDRMGFYLNHPELKTEKKPELLSSAVGFGTIQLLPDGKLLVLMADHQTTGGYPKIGNIIAAHLPKFSQLRPNQPFRLKKISIEEAENSLFSLEQDLEIIENSCKTNLQRYYASH